MFTKMSQYNLLIDMRKNFSRFCTIVFLLFLCTLTVNAAEVRWIGSTNNMWGDHANWEGGKKPLPEDDVVIPSGCTNYPEISDIGINPSNTLKSLKIEAGASVTSGSAVNIKLSGTSEPHILAAPTPFLLYGKLIYSSAGRFQTQEFIGNSQNGFMPTSNYSIAEDAEHNGTVEFHETFSYKPDIDDIQYPNLIINAQWVEILLPSLIIKNTLLLNSNLDAPDTTITVHGTSEINGMLTCLTFQCGGNVSSSNSGSSSGSINISEKLENISSNKKLLIEPDVYVSLQNCNEGKVVGPFSFMGMFDVTLEKSTLQVLGNNDFSSFRVSPSYMGAQNKICFESGKTQTFSIGLTILAGAELLHLESTVSGKPCYLKYTNWGAGNPVFKKVSVKDCHNISSQDFFASNGSVNNGGNNNKWVFGETVNSKITQLIFPTEHGQRSSGNHYIKFLLGVTPKLRESNAPNFSRNIFLESPSVANINVTNVQLLNKQDTNTSWLLCTIENLDNTTFETIMNELDEVKVETNYDYVNWEYFLQNNTGGKLLQGSWTPSFFANLINVEYAYNEPSPKSKFRPTVIRKFDQGANSNNVFKKDSAKVYIMVQGKKAIFDKNVKLVLGQNQNTIDARSKRELIHYWQPHDRLSSPPLENRFDYSKLYDAEEKGDTYLFIIDMDNLPPGIEKSGTILFSFVYNDNHTKNIEQNFVRIKNTLDINSLDVWSITLGDGQTHSGGVTIFNNVVKPKTQDECVIKVDIPRDGHLSVMIMTLDGNVVQCLEKGEVPKGEKYYTWNGKTKSGKHIARGIYFVRVIGCGIDETRKIMVVK